VHCSRRCLEESGLRGARRCCFPASQLEQPQQPGILCSEACELRGQYSHIATVDVTSVHLTTVRSRPDAWPVWDRRGSKRPAQLPSANPGCQPVRLQATSGSGAYASGMSVIREELHHLIDQLPEEQVAPMLALVRESLPVGEDGETLWPLPSFVGTLASGKGDVAARSQEILREEMGRDTR